MKKMNFTSIAYNTIMSLDSQMLSNLFSFLGGDLSGLPFFLLYEYPIEKYFLFYPLNFTRKFHSYKMVLYDQLIQECVTKYCNIIR